MYRKTEISVGWRATPLCQSLSESQKPKFDFFLGGVAGASEYYISERFWPLGV
jgi:hypothetical protein